MKLEKIVLKTNNGKDVKLSLVEAKELYMELDGIFGTKYINTSPIFIDRDMPWHTTYPQTWYGNTTCKVVGDSGMTISYSGTDE